uniref:Uncharacterized protein n=1 Tax=Anguilla anguilla TaxID=7936 RepID=A0A0E9U0Q9_ANGAN
MRTLRRQGPNYHPCKHFASCMKEELCSV